MNPRNIEENHNTNNTLAERIDDGTTRARPKTKKKNHHHHRKKESEETRRFRRRRRRPRVARVFATKRALLFRDGFPKCNVLRARRIVFESESKKDTRNTRKRKTPFRFDREREKREKREKSPPRRVAKKTKRTGGFTSGLFGTSHDDKCICDDTQKEFSHTKRENSKTKKKEYVHLRCQKF